MGIQSQIDNFANAPNSGVFSDRNIFENVQYLNFKRKISKIWHTNTIRYHNQSQKAVQAAMRVFAK